MPYLILAVLVLLCYLGVITPDALAITGVIGGAVVLYVIGVGSICERLRRLETNRNRRWIAVASFLIVVSGPMAGLCWSGTKVLECRAHTTALIAQYERQHEELEAQQVRWKKQAEDTVAAVEDFNQSAQALAASMQEGRNAPQR